MKHGQDPGRYEFRWFQTTNFRYTICSQTSWDKFWWQVSLHLIVISIKLLLLPTDNVGKTGAHLHNPYTNSFSLENLLKIPCMTHPYTHFLFSPSSLLRLKKTITLRLIKSAGDIWNVKKEKLVQGERIKVERNVHRPRTAQAILNYNWIYRHNNFPSSVKDKNIEFRFLYDCWWWKRFRNWMICKNLFSVSITSF